MKVFISWSGEPSRTVAEALRQWIPDVIQFVDPWVSAADIEAGARWNREIEHRLSETQFGILCLTRSNQESTWVNFEAGALAKTIADTFVCPFLIGIKPGDLKPGPLTQFQAKEADRQGTWELIRTLNGALKDNRLSEDRLLRLFERSWPDLASTLQNISHDPADTTSRRPTEEMIREILDIVRALQRRDATTGRAVRSQDLRNHSVHGRLVRALDESDLPERAQDLVMKYWTEAAYPDESTSGDPGSGSVLTDDVGNPDRKDGDG